MLITSCSPDAAEYRVIKDGALRGHVHLADTDTGADVPVNLKRELDGTVSCDAVGAALLADPPFTIGYADRIETSNGTIVF